MTKKKKYKYVLKEKYVDKFKKYYMITTTRESFINKATEEIPGLKYNTALRRFYDCKKLFGKQGKRYLDEDKRKPSMLRLLTVEDLKKYKGKVTRQMLEKQHFATDEINWLEDEGLI